MGRAAGGSGLQAQIDSCRYHDEWFEGEVELELPVPRGTRWSVRESMIRMQSARFSVGDLVHHRLFEYRGVIVEVDMHFRGTEAWYEAVARSRPPKHRPWYHVLPHGAEHQTYVAERNLEPDHSGRPVHHPLVKRYFTGFSDGRYVTDVQMN